jgi:hypothetical protein
LRDRRSKCLAHDGAGVVANVRKNGFCYLLLLASKQYLLFLLLRGEKYAARAYLGGTPFWWLWCVGGVLTTTFWAKVLGFNTLDVKGNGFLLKTKNCFLWVLKSQKYWWSVGGRVR